MDGGVAVAGWQWGCGGGSGSGSGRGMVVAVVCGMVRGSGSGWVCVAVDGWQWGSQWHGGKKVSVLSIFIIKKVAVAVAVWRWQWPNQQPNHSQTGTIRTAATRRIH
jgi:hypothetical protein